MGYLSIFFCVKISKAKKMWQSKDRENSIYIYITNDKHFTQMEHSASRIKTFFDDLNIDVTTFIINFWVLLL